MIDQCGVCGGDNSTCLDCQGTPNGNAHIDQCGVCNGDNSTCRGCDGVPNSGKVLDPCSVCGGDGSTCRDCNGVPNGGAIIDECGVCGGNNSTCRDCAGTINGHAVVDICGVCGGQGTTCGQSCQGALDRCGVCNGNNLCLDCAGIPNGGTAIDCCGVCGGDGTSCPNLCKEYNVHSTKTSFARSVRQFVGSIRKYSKREAACNAKRASAARKRIALAEQLQSTSIVSLSSISDQFKICETVFCAKTSHISILSSAKHNIKVLYKLSRDAQYGALKACGASARRQGGSGIGVAQRALTSSRKALGKIPKARCNN